MFIQHLGTTGESNPPPFCSRARDTSTAKLNLVISQARAGPEWPATPNPVGGAKSRTAPGKVCLSANLSEMEND